MDKVYQTTDILCIEYTRTMNSWEWRKREGLGMMFWTPQKSVLSGYHSPLKSFHFSASGNTSQTLLLWFVCWVPCFCCSYLLMYVLIILPLKSYELCMTRTVVGFIGDVYFLSRKIFKNLSLGWSLPLWSRPSCPGKTFLQTYCVRHTSFITTVHCNCLSPH